ncbi:hypothetical protein V6N12_044878 [Hibiscus sabdariffa]|uniref:Uncharacterized protein n=1 Tax=Hibiscus sabdariffa TaxID=183260 RepID=A0ABR2A575_9ROSI
MQQSPDSLKAPRTTKKQCRRDEAPPDTGQQNPLPHFSMDCDSASPPQVSYKDKLTGSSDVLMMRIYTPWMRMISIY